MLKKLKKILTFWRRKRVLVVVGNNYGASSFGKDARREELRRELEESRPILILEPGETAFYLHE